MRGNYRIGIILASLTVFSGSLALPSYGNSKLRRVPPPKASAAEQGGAAGHGSSSGHGSSRSAHKGVNEKLSYTVPEGWDEVPAPKGYLKTYSRQVDDPETYKASIQIRREPEAHPIDAIFMDEMKEYLVHKIQGSGSPMAKYEVRSGELLTLPSGRKAILIYADFFLGSEAMMHQHFIISSADNHYFFTYTDTKAEMENPGVGTTASRVFESFVAAELPSMGPGRFDLQIMLGVGLFGFIALVLIAQKLVGRKYNSDDADLAEDDGMDADAFTPRSVSEGQQAVTQQASATPQPAKPSKKKGLFSRSSKAVEEDEEMAAFEAAHAMADQAPAPEQVSQPMLTEEPFVVSSDDFQDDGDEADDWNLADTEKTKIS